jgi:hypothetical protein
MRINAPQANARAANFVTVNDARAAGQFGSKTVRQRIN